MNPRNERQFRRMLEVIQETREHQRTLVSAASDLLFLRNEVENLDRTVANEIMEHVLTLESAGTHTTMGVLRPGLSLDQTTGQIHTDGLASFVIDALNQLETLVRRSLEESPTHLAA